MYRLVVVVGVLVVAGVWVEASGAGGAEVAQVRRRTPATPNVTPRTPTRTRGTPQPAAEPQTVRVPVGPQDVMARRLQEARQQRDEERKQWGRDLVFWKQRLAEPADDAETQRALYHVGVGLERLERWTEARQSFERLVSEFPDGRWSGQARVRLIDLALDRSFDPAAAAELGRSAVEWIDRAMGVVAGSPDRATGATEGLPVDQETSGRPRGAVGRRAPNQAAPHQEGGPAVVLEPWTVEEAAFHIYRRAGLLAYLRQEFGEARRLFAQAEPLTPSDAIRSDEQADVLERVHFLARGRRSPTPPAVLEGDRSIAALLVLADVRHAARQFERTEALCQAVLRRATASTGPDKTGTGPTATQRSYGHLLRGRSLLGLPDPKQQSQARGEFLAAHKTDPEAAWAGEALFLAANTHWNQDQNADEAIALWRQLLQDFPDNREAPRAAYFIGITCELTKQYPEAKEAFELARTQFPDSPFAPLIAEHLKKVERELSRSNP